MSYNKSYTYTIGLSLACIIISITAGYWMKLTKSEVFITTLLVAIFEKVFELTWKYIDFKGVHIKSLFEINEIRKYLSLVSKTDDINHPYFRKLMKSKLNDFIAKNEGLLKGVNYTTPHSFDTFGIDGLRYTKQSIKAVSVVPDYWETNFSKKYLEKQEELILNSSVEIQRIFIFPEDKYYYYNTIMKEQSEMGIDVRYLFDNSPYLNKDMIKDDYLIQDDELLVQIFCKSHRFDQKDEKTELITLDQSKVQFKIKQFKFLCSISETYEQR